jgi:hypothetical protein
MTIGKQPAMTNSMEAILDGVKQETADELVGIASHNLLACHSCDTPSIGM